MKCKREIKKFFLNEKTRYLQIFRADQVKFKFWGYILVGEIVKKVRI